MNTTMKKTTEIISIVNKSTREYLIILIDNQTVTPKGIDAMDIDKAFDDMNLQTKSHDLNPDQSKFILQINYFTQKAVLRWLQVKNSLDMGNTLDKKGVNFVFDQMAKSISKYTDLSNEKPVKMETTHTAKV